MESRDLRRMDQCWPTPLLSESLFNYASACPEYAAEVCDAFVWHWKSKVIYAVNRCAQSKCSSSPYPYCYTKHHSCFISKYLRYRLTKSKNMCIAYSAMLFFPRVAKFQMRHKAIGHSKTSYVSPPARVKCYQRSWARIPQQFPKAPSGWIQPAKHKLSNVYGIHHILWR